MSASDWAIIIGAVFLGIAKIVSMILDYFRAKDVAVKVAQVAQVAAATSAQTAEAAEETHQKIDAVHEIVNDQRTRMIAEIAQLKETIAQQKKG